jgi:hypothetical protein
LPTIGETVYLTADKATQFSSFQAYEFHTEQRDTALRAGQTFDIDYSRTQTVPLDENMHRLLQVGLVGYGQYQTTDTSSPTMNPIVTNNHYRVNAIGFGTSLLLPQRKASVGVSWFKEFANRVTVQGQSLQINGTIAF